MCCQPLTHTLTFGVVVIGRNEGERLRRCLQALPPRTIAVYVDSGSTDQSVRLAGELGVDVIELNGTAPFTAARARNAGFQRLRQRAPDLRYVQFIDGDCELIAGWLEHGISFLDSHEKLGAVCGRLMERHPERSIYNWLCQREWDGPIGEIRSCAGNVLMRASALVAAGGYRDDVVAAEEDELSVRLRATGWRIWRLDRRMAFHDASICRFSQWWRRASRSGYAFAQGAYLHGAHPERHFVWESCRAWLWGACLPMLLLAGGLIFGGWAWLALLVYPVQLFRQAARNRGLLRERAFLALFQMLARFAEVSGQLQFLRDCMFRRQAQIIEYK